MELTEILKIIQEVQKYTSSIFLTIFILIVMIYFKYRNKINAFVKVMIEASFTKNRKEHDLLFDKIDSLVILIENGKVEKEQAKKEQSEIKTLILEMKKDNQKIIDEQKRMNYIMKTIIQNKSEIEEKLIEGLKLVDFCGIENIDVPFKAAFTVIPKLVAKFYTELRKEEKNMIGFEDRERAIAALKLIFQEKKLFAEENLKSVLSLARALLNEFNETKRKSDNMELIVTIYGSFIKFAYAEMLKSQ